MTKVLTMSIVIVGILGCEDLQRTRQVRTVADMQIIVRDVEQITAHGISPEEFRERALSRIKKWRSTDAWGTPFVFEVRAGDGRVDYVLVSLGSDRSLDREIDDYFLSSPGLGRGSADRDIVFRNGEAITNAGK
jgi:hypothetical protein